MSQVLAGCRTARPKTGPSARGGTSAATPRASPARGPRRFPRRGGAKAAPGAMPMLGEPLRAAPARRPARACSASIAFRIVKNCSESVSFRTSIGWTAVKAARAGSARATSEYCDRVWTLYPSWMAWTFGRSAASKSWVRNRPNAISRGRLEHPLDARRGLAAPARAGHHEVPACIAVRPRCDVAGDVGVQVEQLEPDIAPGVERRNGETTGSARRSSQAYE